jgi:hypothetical protein
MVVATFWIRGFPRLFRLTASTCHTPFFPVATNLCTQSFFFVAAIFISPSAEVPINCRPFRSNSYGMKMFRYCFLSFHIHGIMPKNAGKLQKKKKKSKKFV